MDMHDKSMHWASQMIGRPYERGASGPDSFDCWGAVRFYFKGALGIEMPAIEVGPDSDSIDNVLAIKRAASVSGWKPSGDRLPAEHDIVLMDGLEGRHVGVMVRANGTLLLLHSLERVGVCVQPLSELQRNFFHGFVFWRFEP